MPSAKKSYREQIEKNIFPLLFFALIGLYFLAKSYLAVILPNQGIEFSDLDLLFGLLLFSVIYFVDKIFKVGFRPRHYVFVFLISLFSFVLIPLYATFFYYDKFIHFMQSILVSSIIFYMVSKLNIKLKWALVFTVLIMVAVGSVWEIAEFWADSFFNLQSQGVFLKNLQGKAGRLQLALDPIIDTDLDMLFNLLGSMSYAFLFLYEEYIHNKKRVPIGALLNSRGA
jgi:hypothetical protein